MNGMRAADRFLACFGQTEKAHLTLPHKLCHGVNGLFDWRVRIDTMLIINIDHINAQSAQTSFASFADIIRLTANLPKVRPGGITQDPKLRSNDGLVTMAA